MTTGKILPGSRDIYDDQARVLVDYLVKVAEHIVTEEERLEREMRSKEEEIAQRTQLAEQKRQQMLIAFVIALIGAIVALAFTPVMWIGAIGSFIWGWNGRSAEHAVLAERATLQTKLTVFKQEFASLKRDYQMRKLGIAWVPVALQVPLEGGHFLVDLTEQAPEREFSLHTVRDSATFLESIAALESAVTSLPIVERSDAMEDIDTSDLSRSIQSVPLYDYLGTMDRSMRNATYLLNDLQSDQVQLPVIDPHGEFAQHLDEHGTVAPAGGARVDLFPTDRYEEVLAAFEALNGQRKAMEGETAQFEEFLSGLMHRLASTVQVITKSKIASSTTLANVSNRFLFAALKASYNHYSPQLEAEEIERIRSETFDYQSSVQGYQPFSVRQSSRVRYDVLSDNWVAEDGRRTAFPFGIHQIHQEVLAPIVERLMTETRLERLKIYENIKDQKLDYLNQWYRDTDDFYGRNRTEGSTLLNLMQGSLTEFTAAYNQYEAFNKTRLALRSGAEAVEIETEGMDAASLVAYKAKMESFIRQQDEFNEFAERLKEEIGENAKAFGFIEYFDASLRDQPARLFADAMERVGELEDRRRPLIAVNPLFAKTASLPPTPELDPVVKDALRLDLEAFARQSLDTRSSESRASSASVPT